MEICSGVIVPLVTAFDYTPEQRINPAGASLLVEKLIASGVEGLFLFGSNGEFYVCSDEEIFKFSEAIITQVAGRVPVYVGVGHCSTAEACRRAKRAEALGADAISVINPYFLGIQDEELISYYTTVAASVTIPLMMYNIPKATGHTISPEVGKALFSVKNIVGIKDSSGDRALLQSYIVAAKTYRPDFKVLVGSDGLISEAAPMGASGIVAGTANLLAPEVVELWNLLQQAGGDGNGNATLAERCAELQGVVDEFRAIIHKGSVPQVLKRSLVCEGFDVGPARLPVGKTTQATDAKIMNFISKLQQRRAQV